MPDISMCKNEECPSKKRCYRFMAVPSDWQTFAYFTVEEGNSHCDYFYPIKQFDRLNQFKLEK